MQPELSRDRQRSRAVTYTNHKSATRKKFGLRGKSTLGAACIVVCSQNSDILQWAVTNLLGKAETSRGSGAVEQCSLFEAISERPTATLESRKRGDTAGVSIRLE